MVGTLRTAGKLVAWCPSSRFVGSVLVVVTIVASGLTWPRIASAGGGGASPAPDEDLNAKGVALRLAGNNKAALEPFQKAYDMTHSPRATAQLGLVHQS